MQAEPLFADALPSVYGDPRAVEVWPSSAGYVRVILHRKGKIVHTARIPGTVRDALQYAKTYFEKRD
mgnify:CR=1 FL=1